MPPGGLSERDRWVVGACLGTALVVAVGLPLFGNPVLFEGRRLEIATWVSLVLLPVPACAAVAAAVLTRLPWVAFSIAATAAFVGGVVSLVSFLGSDWGNGMSAAIGATGLVAWIGWPVVAQLPVLAADLVVRRVSVVTPATGAAAGALVGLLRLVVRASMTAWSPGLDALHYFPLSYWLGDLLLPLVLLTLTGALAGVAAARRDAQSGSGSRTPRS